MDAMKEALRRKIQGMKGESAPAVESEIMEKAEANESSEMAPELEGDAEGNPLANVDEAQLLEILAALADHEAGAGRSPGGLQERAAVGAKEKLVKMKGMKQ